MLGTVAGCVLDGVVAGVVVCASAAEPNAAPPTMANAMIFNFKAFMTMYV